MHTTKGEHMIEEDDDIQDYKKPWVGLTRDEQSFVYDSLHNATSRKDSFWVDFANAIEQRLEEKNT
jgi:predicted transcriptional regulator